MPETTEKAHLQKNGWDCVNGCFMPYVYTVHLYSDESDHLFDMKDKALAFLREQGFTWLHTTTFFFRADWFVKQSA